MASIIKLVKPLRNAPIRSSDRKFNSFSRATETKLRRLFSPLTHVLFGSLLRGNNFEEIAVDALRRSIHDRPQIRSGDPEFDIVVTDIFHQMKAGDPRLASWDDKFKTVLGLYDQVTLGFYISSIETNNKGYPK